MFLKTYLIIILANELIFCNFNFYFLVGACTYDNNVINIGRFDTYLF